jgi:WD40 domain-containing protein
VAVGAPDGSVALHSARSGKLITQMTIRMRSLTALAFSPDGRLLAAGDDDGHVVVYRTVSGEELRAIDTGQPICALAVHDSGSPVLTGTSDGWVKVRRRVLPPLGMAWADVAVTSLAFPVLATGEPVAGRADGVIGKLDPGYQRLTSYAGTGCGPVRAVWAGPRGRVKALAGDGELYSWVPESDASAALRGMPELLRTGAEEFLGWWRELSPLLSAFTEVREQMRDDIAADRAEMLDRLDGLDDGTRDRIRPVVVESAVSIFESYSFDLAISKVFTVNPLPALITGAAALLFIVLPSVHGIAALAHLRSAGAWLAVAGVFAGGIWIVRVLGRLGAAGRLLRAMTVAAGASVWLAGPRFTLAEPAAVRHLAIRWLPAASTVRAVPLAIPYPVWLGIGYVVAPVLAVAGVRWLHRHLRAPRVLARRRRVLGDGLLHALLDVAYQAQIMASDAGLAADPRARRKLHHLVQLAASIASREWARALRTGSRQADRIIRDHSSAIAAEIRRWERPAALAGAQLPKLSSAFAQAVVNAADNDWQALAGEHAVVSVRRRRVWTLVRQALALAVPLGAAAAIAFTVRPLPTALVPILTFLVGLAVARVLRWLDLSGELDPALTISELLRKPG